MAIENPRSCRTAAVRMDSTRKRLWISNSFMLGMAHSLRGSTPAAFAAGKPSIAVTVVAILRRASISQEPTNDQ